MALFFSYRVGEIESGPPFSLFQCPIRSSGFPDTRQARDRRTPRRRETLADQIEQNKADYRDQWIDVESDTLVLPDPFFDSLRDHDEDAQMVVDDGKHTFLTAELFPVPRPRGQAAPVRLEA